MFSLRRSDDGVLTATAVVTLSSMYEGGAGWLHGGILATLMDEAMSKLNKPLDTHAVTRKLEVEYLLPSPIEEELTLVGRHIRREGRKLFHAAELMDKQGRVLVRATGLFISI